MAPFQHNSFFLVQYQGDTGTLYGNVVEKEDDENVADSYAERSRGNRLGPRGGGNRPLALATSHRYHPVSEVSDDLPGMPPDETLDFEQKGGSLPEKYDTSKEDDDGRLRKRATSKFGPQDVTLNPARKTAATRVASANNFSKWPRNKNGLVNTATILPRRLTNKAIAANKGNYTGSPTKATTQVEAGKPDRTSTTKLSRNEHSSFKVKKVTIVRLKRVHRRKTRNVVFGTTVKTITRKDSGRRRNHPTIKYDRRHTTAHPQLKTSRLTPKQATAGHPNKPSMVPVTTASNTIAKIRINFPTFHDGNTRMLTTVKTTGTRNDRPTSGTFRKEAKAKPGERSLTTTRAETKEIPPTRNPRQVPNENRTVKRPFKRRGVLQHA